MDRIEAMGLFIAIVDGGSLASAARRLRIPLQTVSRKLQALEEHLGARLLTRTTRRLALTEEGRDYAEACRRVLADVEDAERRVAGRHGEPKGVLSVTAPVVFGRLHVLPVVLDFLNAYREVETRLVLIDRVIDGRGGDRCRGSYRCAAGLLADCEPRRRASPGDLRQPRLFSPPGSAGVPGRLG